MRRSSRAVGAFAVASLVSTATLAAQGLRPKFGVAAGVAVPTGAYHAAASGEGFNRGWQGIALVTFTVPGWPVGLRVDGTYGTHGANDQLKANLTASIGQPTDEKTKLLGANVDVIYPPGSASRVQPYVLGGMGAYHVTISVTSGGSTTDNSATRFAWNLGGGMRYRMRGVTLFLEARYVDVAAVTGFPKTTFLPITVGIRFGSP
jgi:opacity protein-like surface antigen